MTTQIKRKLIEIMSLSYDLNAGTDLALFFDFHGHVNLLSLRILSDKNISANRVEIMNRRIFVKQAFVDDELDEMLALLQRLVTAHDLRTL
ncbi:hypothetical protein [Paenibacillus sp. PDC88]|uniref:hypothetical protein n=1 Tax=Paenibacillus sp. PDC88 TaxID=1884375 RepID=UPI0008941DEF|nr:hypothetical protein [Paenibacillus sp. PDC88]SDW22949.1 hypothetical protein SAMN05518848_101725 [Paenibacillus sp. PDC88]